MTQRRVILNQKDLEKKVFDQVSFRALSWRMHQNYSKLVKTSSFNLGIIFLKKKPESIQIILRLFDS